MLAGDAKRAELYSLLSRAYYGSGRIKDAYDALRTAARLEPDDERRQAEEHPRCGHGVERRRRARLDRHVPPIVEPIARRNACESRSMMGRSIYGGEFTPGKKSGQYSARSAMRQV